MRLVPDPARDLASCLEDLALRDAMARLHTALEPILGDSLEPLSLPRSDEKHGDGVVLVA